MNDTGKNVVAAVAQLRKLNREIGRLLEHADEQMAGQGWEARGNQCVSGSRSLEAPQEWLPVVIFRLYYVAKQKNLLGFVSVIIDDHDAKGRIVEPLISAGWCDYGTGKEANPGLLWRWADCHVEQTRRVDDGTVLIEEDKKWLEPERFDVVRYGSLALPLVAITTAEELKNRIIKPLLAGIDKAGKISAWSK